MPESLTNIRFAFIRRTAPQVLMGSPCIPAVMGPVGPR